MGEESVAVFKRSGAETISSVYAFQLGCRQAISATGICRNIVYGHFPAVQKYPLIVNCYIKVYYAGRQQLSAFTVGGNILSNAVRYQSLKVEFCAVCTILCPAIGTEIHAAKDKISGVHGLAFAGEDGESDGLSILLL